MDLPADIRTMATFIFDDVFLLKTYPYDQKFEKVSRVSGLTEQFNVAIELDINTDIYPVQVNERFKFSLSRTLDIGGRPDTGEYDPMLNTRMKPSLADDFDYVMYGKTYKVSADSQTSTSVYVSFGGLLLKMTGNPKNMPDVEPDTRLYLLMKKTSA